MIPESNLPPEESPREILEANPADWITRLQSASLLYDQGVLDEASALIWEADRIPCSALDLALAACILAKDQPGKAIRLLTAVLENNRGKAAQNMGMANALLHHGMVLQAARFYGAALEINQELVNLEFEHFFIRADDEQLLWGDLNGRRSQLHELPWMTRDSTEALKLTRDVSRHTTPIAVPKVDQVKVGSPTTKALREKLAGNPSDWDTRRTLAQLLHDQGDYGEAAVLIWDSDPIPGIDLDIAFAAGALARQQPRKAIRLLTAVFEQNRKKSAQNMGMANALLHHGMVFESARFYGAALDADPDLVNPDFEHFLLWTDDAKSLWEDFLKIRPPLGLFPWVQSTPTLDFGTPFSNPPIMLSGLRQVQGENLTNPLYQQLAEKNARITPPPAVTFPADRMALNDRRPEPNGHEEITGPAAEEEAKVEAAAKARADAAAKRLTEEQAAAEAKAASLFAEAAESAKTLIERARQEATSEVAAIRTKAQEELQAALEQARQNTEQEMAALRAKAREEAEAAADAARKDAEIQAALIRAKAEEAAAQAEAAAKLLAAEYARAFALAKQRTEEEERSTATAKQLAAEQANAAAEQAAAAQVAAEKARQEAISEVAAMRAKAQEELKVTLEQARQTSEQEMAAIRAKAREEAKSEAALIRTKAEEDARAAEIARLEATAQADAAAKLRAEENDRALAVAKQRAEEEERSAAAAKRLVEEQARAAAEKIHQEAIAELAAIKALAQEELKTATELARLNSEQELTMLRAKAREESKALMENAAKAAASELAPISPKSEEDAKSPPAAVANAAAVIKARGEQERAIPVAEARIRQQGATTKRRLCVLLVAAAAAMAVWQWIPGTGLDRAVFATVASGSSNGALFTSGKGNREEPWTLRTFSTDRKADKRQAPVIVSLGDDLKGFFQSSPPAPIDLAVIFSNFHRLGAKKAAAAAVFSWEKPDPIGLAALEKSLDRFDSLVMAAPLSRGVVSSPMPPAFRRTSIAEGKIRGETAALPLVNRLPIQGIVLGGETTLAGFSALESEPPSRFVPLLARWEDRVVFSFSLLAVLQRLDLPLDGVEVRLGEFLKLGPVGPIVPIDASGRLTLPLKRLSPYAEISAEALIDGGDDLFPRQAPDPVILRDDQTAAEPATREFSRNLSAIIAAIASNQGLSEAREFPRLSQDWELGILAAVVVVLILLAGASDFVRNMGALVLAGVCVAAQWIAFGVGSIWLPGLPMLVAIVAAMVVYQLFTGKSPELARGAVSSPPVEPELSPAPKMIPEPVEIAVTPQAKPETAAKTPVKKVAAKKEAAKKAVAKKAASPRTPRPKKPPTDP